MKVPGTVDELYWVPRDCPMMRCQSDISMGSEDPPYIAAARAGRGARDDIDEGLCNVGFNLSLSKC